MLIRPAQPADLAGLMELCGQHAVFERATPPRPQAARSLAAALWGQTPRAWCLVVQESDELVGYTSYALEFSTWAGREFLHLDCLYLRESHRGRGAGALLMQRVTEAARELGADEVQWQTPGWNSSAERFYRRQGAVPSRKTRFRLPSGHTIDHHECG